MGAPFIPEQQTVINVIQDKSIWENISLMVGIGVGLLTAIGTVIGLLRMKRNSKKTRVPYDGPTFSASDAPPGQYKITKRD